MSEQKPQDEQPQQEAPSEKVVEKEGLDALLRRGSAGDVSKEGGETSPATPLSLEDLGSGDRPGTTSPIDMLVDVSLDVRIELGRSKMAVENILKLQSGSVVTLDRLAGDYVDVLVNDRLVARGEVLVLNDNFCVRIAEIVSPDDRLGQTS